MTIVKIGNDPAVSVSDDVAETVREFVEVEVMAERDAEETAVDHGVEVG